MPYTPRTSMPGVVGNPGSLMSSACASLMPSRMPSGIRDSNSSRTARIASSARLGALALTVPAIPCATSCVSV